MKELELEHLTNLLTKAGSLIEPAMLKAIIDVETGGQGFDTKTGKILIQFEPVWFKRKTTFAPSGLWSVNKVEVQAKEWPAFNNAFKINKEAAMEATSIGLPQIMGFHWKRLGYDSVGAMWDDFKEGLDNQINALIIFIETDIRLWRALRDKNFVKIADVYNGSEWLAIAIKYGREPYPDAIKKAYLKYGGKL